MGKKIAITTGALGAVALGAFGFVYAALGVMLKDDPAAELDDA